MGRHYTYLMQFFLGEHGADWEKFFTAALLMLLLIVVGVLSVRGIRSREKQQQALVPPPRGSLTAIFDFIIEGYTVFHDSMIGEKNRKHIPFTASIFLFIFAANLLGLIPGMAAVTTTVWINVGMALVVFFSFNFYGIKEHGALGYLKHFFGGPELIKGALFLVGAIVCFFEMLSTVLRILTLNLRLYWNVNADHIILNTMVELGQGIPVLGYLISAPFYFLGTFVSFMQAFVFTVLTMIYILLATQHEESEH